MEESLFPSDITSKFYTDRAVLIGTFIGGPLVGAYLIAQNFKTLNEPSKVRQTWFIAIGALVVAVGIGLIPPLDKIPSFLFSIVFCLVAHSITKKYQGERIAAHQAAGGAVYATGRAVLIGFVGCALMIGLLLGLFYLMDGAV